MGLVLEVLLDDLDGNLRRQKRVLFGRELLVDHGPACEEGILHARPATFFLPEISENLNAGSGLYREMTLKARMQRSFVLFP